MHGEWMYLEHTTISEWNTDVSTASYYIRKELYFNSAILHGYGHGVKCQKPIPRNPGKSRVDWKKEFIEGKSLC